MKVSYSLNKEDLLEILRMHFKEKKQLIIEDIEIELKTNYYRNEDQGKEFDCINLTIKETN